MRDMVVSTALPAGFQLRRLEGHSDARGTFTEAFRTSWWPGVEPVQWNVVKSAAGALRGLHVHVVHKDVYILAEGSATLGLRDVRAGSPTEGVAATVELIGTDLQVAVIPQGVLHGVVFHEASLLFVGVTTYYDPTDDVACRWSDPALGIEWPREPTLISERDASAPPLSDVLEQLQPWQPIGAER